MIEDFLNHLMTIKKYSDNTILSYKNDLQAFEFYVKSVYSINSFAEINESHIRSWFSMLIDDGFSPSSIRRRKSSLSTFFKFLQKQGVVKRNPAIYIQSHKLPRRLPDYVPEKKITELFEVDFFSIKDYDELLDRMILETFYATGVRVSELIKIKDSAFDFAAKTLKVRGKGHKERIIPLMPEFMKMVEHFIDRRNEFFSNKTTIDSFFLTKKGKKIYEKFAYRVINSYLCTLNCTDKKSPHVMRHTFATHLLNAGADINAIKELLGHSSLAATQVYTHNTIERLKSVYKKTHPKSKKRRYL